MGPLAAAGIAAGIGAGIDTISNIGTTAWNHAYNSNEAQKARDFEAEQAVLARDFQSQQNELTRQFNSAEAQKARDWQENMSNTAYQRSRKDMEAAGMNPNLLASGASASTPSGASASSAAGGTSKASGTSASASVGYFSQVGKLVVNSALKAAFRDKRISDELNKEISKKYSTSGFDKL